VVAAGRVDLSAANTTLERNTGCGVFPYQTMRVSPAKVEHCCKSLVCASRGVCDGWELLSCSARAQSQASHNQHLQPTAFGVSMLRQFASISFLGFVVLPGSKAGEPNHYILIAKLTPQMELNLQPPGRRFEFYLMTTHSHS